MACSFSAVARAAAAWAACCWACAQLGDRDGQCRQVRDERDGGQRAVAADLAGQGDQPGGGAQLASLAGGAWYPAVPVAGGAVVAVRGAAQLRVAQRPRRDVQGVGRRPGRIGGRGRIAAVRRAGCAPRRYRPGGPRARRSRSVPGR